MIGDAARRIASQPVATSSDGAKVLDAIRVMAILRGPSGCPWDHEQTHRTLARHLLEETHELLEAIDSDEDAAVRDELGDLLLQVLFHSQISADGGGWDVDDVADGLIRKLVHRHPHVFGDVEVSGSSEVLINWEKLKAEEEGRRKRVDEDLPSTLPALSRAAKAQRRAAGWGFEHRSVRSAVESLREAVAELASAAEEGDHEEEIGDVLFATVALARKLGVDAESALRRTTSRFAERYERFEELAAEQGIDVATAEDSAIRELFRQARDELPF